MVDLQTPLADVRLLIVEDEPLIAMMVEDYAIELGCRSYQTAGTETLALTLIRDYVPQLVLLDCALSHAGPRFIVADALDDHLIPFIFTSGHSSDILPIRHKDRDFLVKPFSIDDLRDAILRIRAGGVPRSQLA